VTPFVPFTDGAQVTLHYVLFGEPCSNRLWFLNRQPPTTAIQLDALADGCRVWYEELMLPILSEDLLLQEVRATDWSSDPPFYVAVSPSLMTGQVSVESHSANVADRVKFQGSTAQTWRDNSHFIPGIPESAVTGNTVDLAFRSAVFEAYVALIDRAAVFGPFPAWRWMTASSWSNGSLRSSLAVARTDFIKFANPWSTQRRRRLPR